jgi:acetyl-CoA carboxylase carboxyl transferase subunit beta
VHRHELRSTLARLCRLLTKSPALSSAPKAAPQVMVEPEIIVPAAEPAPAVPHA